MEFLDSEDLQLGRIITFRGNQFTLDPQAITENFFRIRRIGKHRAKGFWTEAYRVQDFIREPLSIEEEEEPTITKVPELPVEKKSNEIFLELEKNGKKLLFLNGRAVSIQPETQGSIEIEKIIYRLNNGEWQNYKDNPLEFREDGEYQMDYYSVDILGNVEPTQSVIFLVDNKAPMTRVVYPSYEEKSSRIRYVAGTIELKLEAKDNVSGVDKSYYRFLCQLEGSKQFQTYQDSISLESGMKECGKSFYLEYYSEDRLGNREKPKTRYFSWMNDK